MLKYSSAILYFSSAKGKLPSESAATASLTCSANWQTESDWDRVRSNLADLWLAYRNQGIHYCTRSRVRSGSLELAKDIRGSWPGQKVADTRRVTHSSMRPSISRNEIDLHLTYSFFLEVAIHLATQLCKQGGPAVLGTPLGRDDSMHRRPRTHVCIPQCSSGKRLPAPSIIAHGSKQSVLAGFFSELLWQNQTTIAVPRYH